jgi:Holliday junction resolvase RusA-like endonuclease
MGLRISQAEYDAWTAAGLIKQPKIVTAPRGQRIDQLDRILLFIPGPPPGKPRMTQRDKWKKRPPVVAYHEWCDRVREVAGNIPPAEEIAAVNWTAIFEPPPSWTKRKRAAVLNTPHRSKPDRDNVDKAILDCLWKQDSGIHCGYIAKFWGTTAHLQIEIVLNTPFDKEPKIGSHHPP